MSSLKQTLKKALLSCMYGSKACRHVLVQGLITTWFLWLLVKIYL